MDNSRIAEQIVEMARAGTLPTAVESVKQVLDQMNSLFSAEHNAIVAGNPVPKKQFLIDHRVFLIKLAQEYGGKKIGGHSVVQIVYDPATNSVDVRGD